MPGLTLRGVEAKSHLRKQLDRFIHPKVATTNFVVASVDPSGLTAGQTLTLSAAAAFAFRHPRKVTLTVDDDDGGGGLAVTVLVQGHRFGKPIEESLTATATDGNALTVTSTKVFDQVTAARLLSKASADSGDAILLGIAGTALGLTRPISKVTDVICVCNDANGTEATPLAPSATVVDVPNSALLVPAGVAATDLWEVTYVANGPDEPGLGNNGVYA